MTSQATQVLANAVTQIRAASVSERDCLTAP